MLKVLGKLRRYWLPLLLLAAATLAGVYADLYLPTLMARIINEGVSSGDYGYILATGGEMLLFSFLGILCVVASGALGSRVSMGFGRDLRAAVFRKAASLSLTEFDSFGTATLITRTTNDINQLQMFVMMAFRILIRAPLMIVGGVTMAMTSSSQLSRVVLLSVPTLIAIVAVVSCLALPLSTTIQRSVDRVNLILREKLTGLRVERAFGTEEYEEERFDRANRDLTAVSVKMHRTMAVLMPGITLLMSCTQIFLVWSGAVQIDAGNLLVGDMMAVIQYVMQIMMSFMMFSMIFVMMPRAIASGRRISQVLETPEAIADPVTPAREPSLRGTVEFRDVSLTYQGAEKPVLEGISFTARPGETTAIIGSTGSGKSTLVNLIPRFFDATGGQVLVDGVDVREMTQRQLRDRIGFVPQKALLFRGTIRENIAYGKAGATDQELWEAAGTAQALDFIRQKPGGLDSPVAQLGQNFSGGQKQRLAIARALVRRPEIYIFDDSFSALDARTDAALRAALKERVGDATVLIVAQKVSTIRDADRILVLDNGGCVGMGTHRELLESCPVYQEIVYSQMAAEEVEP
ncbi:MAG: ABC transporter ATP-binding protein [Angelakisella sp.]|jgi:ATP-binding cassette subfamily B multidrug efflux pump|nr:ABC transporter ATP-binding protein [Angelakisella sp.]